MRFAAGDESSEFLESYSVTFRSVPAPHIYAHFGTAIWYYDGPLFSALQLVWPDRYARWPWSLDAPPEFATQQPVLETEPLPEWAHDKSTS